MAWTIETVFDLSDEDLFAEMVAIDLGQFMWDTLEVADPGYDQWQDNLVSYTIPVGATSLIQVQFDGTTDPIPVWEDTVERFFTYVRAIHQAEFNPVDLPAVLEMMLPGQLSLFIEKSDWLETIVEPVNLKPLWADLLIKDAELLALNIKNTLISNAYNTMNSDIAVEIFSVFKTASETSAAAFAQSWRMKMDRPAEYFSEGLLAQEAIAGFAINDPLDTEAKILSYYTEKVEQLIAFDKFRDGKIMIYLAAKAAAEA